MTTEMLQVFIPIVAILVVFGFPVALIFTLKWFKLKDKELQVDSEIRRTTGQALESRVQRLESIILALDSDLRAKIASSPRSELYESPAPQQAGLPGPSLEDRGKTRE